MYIKELEELAHANKNSESDRNNLLMQETAILKREMLRIRSNVFKAAATLNAIGTEVSKILDNVSASGMLLAANEGDRPSQLGAAQVEKTTQLSTPASSAPSEASTHTRPLDPLDSESMDNHGCEGVDSNLEIPAIPRHAADSGLPDEESSINPLPVQESRSSIDCVLTLPDWLPWNPAPSGGDLSPLQSLLNDWNHDSSAGAPQDIPFTAGFSRLASTEDLIACTVQELSPGQTRMTQRESPTVDGLAVGTSESIPAAPSQLGLALPPGLLPPAKRKSPHGSCQMQSRLSEHIEVLEHTIRSNLYIMPGKVSRQL
jgi:hypothetical protein